jgi:hypothetical protein
MNDSTAVARAPVPASACRLCPLTSPHLHQERTASIRPHCPLHHHGFPTRHRNRWESPPLPSPVIGFPLGCRQVDITSLRSADRFPGGRLFSIFLFTRRELPAAVCPHSHFPLRFFTAYIHIKGVDGRLPALRRTFFRASRPVHRGRKLSTSLVLDAQLLGAAPSWKAYIGMARSARI